MPDPLHGPARAGVFVYAKGVQKVAGFYEAILGMSRLRESEELVILDSADLQLTVHAIPPMIAASIVISDPPARRESSAYKFFFTVPDLAEATRTAAALGGEVLPEEWQGPGFRVRNAVDPEGNIFQLRESTR